MGIGLNREGYLRMPQQVADVPWADSLSQQERGCAVAEVVEPDGQRLRLYSHDLE
jgi:hypothetical protein